MNIRRSFPCAIFALASAITTHAQSSAPKATDCSKLPHAEYFDCVSAHSEIKTIYLKNPIAQNDANEIMVAARNLTDPGLKIYLDPAQSAIMVNTYPEEIARIEGIIRSLDLPRKTFRLTYTITELDAGKTLGTEHLSMVVEDGQRTTVKQGDKVPVATGSYSSGAAESSSGAGIQTQFTYLDVGMNIDATLTAIEGGASLKTKVEQSSIGQTSTIAGVTEPIVRQTVVEGQTLVTLGKPVMIGSIDIPNTTRRYDIAVVMDTIK
jgi:type II secretory pathway component GspD/PulD (secretin)